nr:periphilin-1 isoform X3 [Geotrypetes seraphini]XP_033814441.1 periphilin-1 isoform X3 [Geotrypetes seraphini]XP_033814442.1 periphilin-1 isoform X3 [Geotrypetes seraphini]XP_033814443.1 periphilin-1 isoform X3 [Geotrypetes seraphini]
MWPEGRFDYDRLPRQRLPPRGVHPDEYHRVVHFPSRRIPLERPEEGDHYRYEDYSCADYIEYEESHGLGHDRRSGPSYRGEDLGYRWHRDEHHLSRHPERHPEYRESREGFRRKPFYPPHVRDRSPHFRESPVSRKDSPHSRSGSSISSRSYSPERSKAYSAHHSQHNRSKEQSLQSLKSSRDASPSSSTAMPSSKATALDKSSRVPEAALAEAASKWVAEKKDKVDENSLPEITDEYPGSSATLYGDQPEEHEAKYELFETSRLDSRSKTIASKTKEIEEVYRQDCETFGMVVKMLIDKDPSLEKPIQFALRQNLNEIGERCIEELKHFITEYDARSQEFTDSF